MGIIESSNYSSFIPGGAINSEQQIFNQIKQSGSGKEQLKKTATEFESVFIAKMFSVMDETVDREGGIFGEETQYFDNLKSYMYNEMGRSLASNPHSTFGFAKQIYEQMEKYVKE
jgi:Rod binding domain-containing protein